VALTKITGSGLGTLTSDVDVQNDSAKISLTRTSNSRAGLVKVTNANGGIEYHSDVNGSGETSIAAHTFTGDAPSADTTYMTILGSGRLFVSDDNNVSDNNNANLCINHSSSTRGVNLHTTGTSGSDRVTFQNDNGTVGTINTTGSSTSYATSSDYRIKENVEYTWDATTRLKQLKPARFNFIADDTNTLVDGLIAHEVSSIVPEAVVGQKDAVDDDGNPVMQGLDQSKLVPLLVKTIQELEARITALESA